MIISNKAIVLIVMRIIIRIVIVIALVLVIVFSIMFWGPRVVQDFLHPPKVANETSDEVIKAAQATHLFVLSNGNVRCLQQGCCRNLCFRWVMFRPRVSLGLGFKRASGRFKRHVGQSRCILSQVT